MARPPSAAASETTAMRYYWKWGLSLAAVVGGVLALPPLEHWWRSRAQTPFRTARVQRGEIVSVVNATGTVTPVLSVRVGSFVSGQVAKLNVDYNSPVKKGDLLAKIDDTIYQAAWARDDAAVKLAQAEVSRVTAQLAQAIGDWERACRLRAAGKDIISAEEVDRLRAARRSLEAQLISTKAQVKQAEANREASAQNLRYTEIRSPVDGIVIDRKIDEGQTLVAQFLAPDLFVVAQDLRSRILVYATIDEADVAQVEQARGKEGAVGFTVDALPTELFKGTVERVRLNPTTKENVVTYTVEVSTTNYDLKLKPGMTAKLSIEVARRKAALKLPNAALRFYPKVEQVREEDRKLLEVTEEPADSESADKTSDDRSASQRALDRSQGSQRLVWVAQRDGRLRAVKVTTGLSDYKFTEVVSGDLDEGQELVTGIKR
jgi:HlyD family secretion protein